MIFWYQIFYFLISENDFLISRNPIFDIKKSTLLSGIKNSISWYQEIVFLISQIRILDIRKWFFEIKKPFFDINNYFLISIINYWYQKFELLIQEKSFSNNRKYLKNIKTAPHRIQWFSENFQGLYLTTLWTVDTIGEPARQLIKTILPVAQVTKTIQRDQKPLNNTKHSNGKKLQKSWLDSFIKKDNTNSQHG